MGELEEKLNAALNNPQLMQQIMAMAQSMGTPSPPEPPKEPTEAPPFPNIDINMLQKLSGLASQSGIDRNQQTLLKALDPYLSHDRISRLERAMRAAKMARMASSFLGAGGLQSLSGR